MKSMNLSLTLGLLLSALVFEAGIAKAYSKEDYARTCLVRTLIESKEPLESSTTKRINSVAELTEVEAGQILIAARLFDGQPKATPQASLFFLERNSEGGQVSQLRLDFEEGSFDVVKSYPGGNPYAIIFERGTTNVLAQISDSDVICL